MHQMFYVLTALIVGSWAVSSQYLTLPLDKFVLNVFSSVLAFAGFIWVRKLQGANDKHAVIVNLIRKHLHIDEATVKIDSSEEQIIPKIWKQYKLVTIKDCYVFPRRGLRGGGRVSQWAMYKWIYLIMLIIGVLKAISSMCLVHV
jgi:hypothetical protein